MTRLAFLALMLPLAAAPPPSTDSWQRLSEKEARRWLTAMRVNGRVGKIWDTRVLSTDRSYNYKLRATWITPGVAAAAARLLVLTKNASSETAESLVREFTSPSWHYVVVEIDPREGSGVIPRDWTARFGPAGTEGRDIAGEIVPEQEPWRIYVSAFPRNYDYDVFLVRFPTRTSAGAPVLDSTDKEAQLAVRIHDKAGHVRWPIPAGSVGSVATNKMPANEAFAPQLSHSGGQFEELCHQTQLLGLSLTHPYHSIHLKHVQSPAARDRSPGWA